MIEGEWISASDKRPELNVNVIACNVYSEQKECFDIAERGQGKQSIPA